MDIERKPKGHENFYIDLNLPSGFVFTDSDIVSGKCVLLSAHDEDVGSILVSFHGIVKTYVDIHNYSQSTQVHNTHYASEDILFSETKTLYQGNYKLRKNTLYEWPFEFQFPNLLPPAGTFGRVNNGSSNISYELKACRGRTYQDPASLEKHINPRTDLKGAPFQPKSLFAKLGTFTGMVASTTLPFVPPRPRRAESYMIAESIDHHSPSKSPGRRHKFTIPFRDKEVIVDCGIVLEMPRNLFHGTSIPVRLRVSSDEDSPLLKIYLQHVDIHLISHTTIHSSSGKHNTQESKHPIFSVTRRDIALTLNCWLNLSTIFDLQLDPNIVPTFKHDLVELCYDLRVNITIENGKNKFVEEFFVGGVQVLSNRTRSSPLSRDNLCSFTSASAFKPLAPPKSQIADEKCSDTASDTDAGITKAYLALSRLLNLNSIPHNPIPSRTGIPTIILHGRAPLYISSTWPPPSSPPLLSSTTSKPSHEPIEKDQICLDTIIEKHPDFRAVSLPKKGNDGRPEVFAYSWTESLPQAFSSAEGSNTTGMSIRIEITGM